MDLKSTEYDIYGNAISYEANISVFFTPDKTNNRADDIFISPQSINHEKENYSQKKNEQISSNSINKYRNPLCDITPVKTTIKTGLMENIQNVRIHLFNIFIKIIKITNYSERTL